MLKKLFAIIFLFTINGLFAQTDSLLVKPSPDGIYLFVSGEALHPDYKNQEGIVKARIFRTEAGNDDFTELGSVQRENTFDQFKEIVGQEFINEALEFSEFTTEESFWNYILENPVMQEYGFLTLDMNFLRAMGAAYLDNDVDPDENYKYRVDYLDSQGNVVNSNTTRSVNINEKPNITKPISQRIHEDDSLIVVTWKAEPIKNNEAFFARVYKSAAGKNNFSAVEELIAATNTDSGIMYEFHDDSLNPESSFRYYLEPMTLVKQPGPLSDTVVAYSIAYLNIPLLGYVVA